ncbi:MAG TPA: GNAT family N-acetyltransferase [Tepidisphaeraceae bacterium]|jgi:predicted N-acyltransferase|nr:GNAT family N-acetyltransferase [Tepidisphaeraceae bacterium]
MTDSSTLPRFNTTDGTVYVAQRQNLEQCPAWKTAFANSRKDWRYYQIVEDTILQGFDYRYFVLEDAAGVVKAIQPFFLLAQDILQGSGPAVLKWAGRLRRIFPKALTIRTLMVGCAAGEGHLDQTSDEQAAWIASSLQEALVKYARSVRTRMIVLKEFPAKYREPLACFAQRGYTRVPSLPFTRLNIDYADFEEYMNKALSKNTRKDLRRKFRDAEAGEAIAMEVVNDITPYVDELYPLYLNVYRKSPLQFERLTKEYLCRLGSEMPDKVRFFIWRQKGRAVAFSVCMLQGDAIYDEYLGLDYDVALDLHLYFYTLRDIVSWAMKQRIKWYCSSALNYDPKRRLKCELMPMDLYVTHTSPLANFVLRKVLPLLEPTRNDKTLREFPNYDALWGTA